jgi:lysophospholipase L1-like esterase
MRYNGYNRYIEIEPEETTPEEITATEEPATIETIETTEPTTAETTVATTQATTAATTARPVPATQRPTAAPATTEPPAPPPQVYIESPPRTDFIQLMFDNAITAPGNGSKVEPPPKGRSAELQHKIVPLSENIPEPFSYFDNIVMLGDSVTLGFDVFKNRIRFNGEAVLSGMTVVSSGSYGVFEAEKQMSDSTVHPRIGGVQHYPEDIIAGLDAKNVLICLGLNDTWIGLDNYITHYSTLIKRIQQKSPDKNIVIMSVTPVTRGQTRLSIDRIDTMNNALIEFAMANGYMFIDFGAALRDEDNFLYTVLSSDDYCHLTLAAYNRLVEYMLYHPIR